MLPRPRSTLLASLCAALLPSAAWADGTTVSGTGEATVKVVPAKVHVLLQIAATGKTAELALQRLKARREATAETLRGLGAEKESIIFSNLGLNKLLPPPCYPAGPAYSSPPTFPSPLVPQPVPPPAATPPTATSVPPELPPSGVPGDASSPGPSGYQPATPSPSSPSSPPSIPFAYPPAAASGPGTTPSPGYGAAPPSAVTPAAPPAPGKKEVYLATATLTVEWSLGVNTAAEAFLAGEAIRKKVLAAGLVGTSADDRELPFGTTIPSGASPQVQTPNGIVPQVSTVWGPNAVALAETGPSVTLVYAATISSQQRKAILAEAFRKAKLEAAEMAEAAGGKLGAVTDVSGGTAPWMPPAGTSADGNEAWAPDPGEIRFRATVNAKFRLD